MGLDDAGLNLGLGFAVPAAAAAAAEAAIGTMYNRTRKMAAASSLEPSLTLGISSISSSAGGGGGDDQEYSAGNINHRSTKLYGRVIDSPTTTSFSNGGAASDDGEDDIIININNININNSRKKLRLNRDQSALLEQCFKQHSTLNPKQKQELARKLNLRPRQVEVWFQNRRARTKLKQTEINCEFLKKCCETLTDENRRLQKELHELKSLKLPGLYMQLPATTLSICPSCERIGGAASESEVKDSDKNVSMVGSNPTHLYNPFANPSAAC